MTPDDKLARTRLAIETALKRADQRLARKQYALAEAQFEWQREQATHSGWKLLLTPTGVVIVGAAIGLLGTAAGKWADYLTTKRQQETTIILKASEVPLSLPPAQQDLQRARNLLWFAEANYIDLPTKFIAQLQKASKLEAGETLPPPIVESQSKIDPVKLGLTANIIPNMVSIKPGGYHEVTHHFAETGNVDLIFDSEDYRWILSDGTILGSVSKTRILGGFVQLKAQNQASVPDNIYLPPEIYAAAMAHGESRVRLEFVFNAHDPKSQATTVARASLNITFDRP